ncbi:MAG: phosphoglycerate kinase [Armatimonadia bacterium]|nr:phosphoglycerate kinase [Armatimonadia bacterium]
MAKRSVTDIDPKGKRVLCRVDFNVPLDDDRNITDDSRIQAALPTINFLLEKGGKVILISHLGRPKGEKKPEFNLDPVAKRLAELVDAKVTKTDDVVGPEVTNVVGAMQPGEIVLLENSRFEPGEEKNDPALGEALGELADIYVNDAFGAAHRAHASTEGVTKHVDTCVAGFLMQKELEILGDALLEEPKRPVVAILGGAKVADKLGVIESLLKVADTLIIGGGMSYTFLKAKGYEVGQSLLDADRIEYCSGIILKAEETGTKLLLPTDVLIADDFKADANTKVVPADQIPADWMGLDMGPESTRVFCEAAASAGTAFWNGPMGVFEMEAFAGGTKALAKALAESDAVTIIGGGDSAAAVRQMGFADAMTHISTGGGASLEFVEQGSLPCVEVLDEK